MPEAIEHRLSADDSGSYRTESLDRPTGITDILARARAFSPRRTAISLVLGDALALIMTFTCCVLLRFGLGGDFTLGFYFIKLPLLLLIPLVFHFFKLYPGMLYPTHLEIRRLTIGTSSMFLFFLALTFITKDSALYSRSVLFGTWALSLFTVPITRSLVRSWGVRHVWWGRPAVLFGSDKATRKLFLQLESRRKAGITPLCLVRLDHDDDATENLPVITMHQARRLATIRPHPMAIAIFRDATPETHALMNSLSAMFRKVLFIPSFLGLASIWLTVRDLGPSLALETEHKLLDPTRMRAKRAMDLGLIILALPVLLPVCSLLALVIFLYDRGPVFYSQERIGHQGRPIHILKFRTMVRNADALLEKHLRSDPELAREWAEQHKLTNDPRVTAPGRLLRKLSLDELPQICNVLKGDLSLVGPRPIVRDEIEKYGPDFELLKQAPGGLTGLWQISGRSRTSYERRVELDAYYIRNWSIWLDIYILAKTPMALFRYNDAC